MKDKEDILYNLLQAERLLQKTIFLVEDQRALDQIEYDLQKIKQRLSNLVFDIEEINN